MGVQVIKTFVGDSGKVFSFDVEVPGGAAQLVLMAQAQVAATNTADFELVAGEGWTVLAERTLAGNNRRYRGGVWAVETPAAGTRRIEVRCGRMASLMAFVMVVEEPEPEPEPEAPERRELSVVVRELAAGETHEVRYVRPAELVMTQTGIDWERTVFRGHVFTVGEGE